MDIIAVDLTYELTRGEGFTESLEGYEGPVQITDLGGTATSGEDYILTNLGNGNFSYTILTDDLVEGLESFSFVTTWIGPRDNFNFIYRETWNIDIIDDAPCEDLAELKQRLSELERLQGALNIAQQELDLINDGKRILETADRAIDIANFVSNEVSAAVGRFPDLRDGLGRALSDEYRSMYSAMREVNEQVNIEFDQFDFAAVKDATDSLTSAYNGLAQEAQRLGLNIIEPPSDPSVPDGFNPSLSIPSGVFDLLTKLLAFAYNLRSLEIGDLGTSAKIERELEEFEPKLAAIGEEFSLSPDDYGDINEYSSAIEVAIEQEIDAVEMAIADCGMNSETMELFV